MGLKKQIKELMTPAPHTVGKDQPLSTAKDLMVKNGIRHLPVRDSGRIIGILSDRDIDFALRVDKRPASELIVEDALTADVFAAAPDTSVSEVAGRMAKDRIGCALIEDAHGKLLGIFTTVDACKALAELS